METRAAVANTARTPQSRQAVRLTSLRRWPKDLLGHDDDRPSRPAINPGDVSAVGCRRRRPPPSRVRQVTQMRELAIAVLFLASGPASAWAQAGEASPSAAHPVENNDQRHRRTHRA